MFSFGPLSGLADIVNGQPGTETASVFNQSNVDPSGNVLDVVKIGAPYPNYYVGGDPFKPFNGAIGLVPDVEAQNGNIPVQPTSGPGSPPGTTPAAWAQQHSLLTGHVDPRLVMDVGVLNGNIPAPMIAIDEGDELFLTLTNVGMVMRPDLFEQHTVHFHGYPNASAYYDGVPDASIAINIGGSFTYYYLAPEAGTYMWHCHISPPEHLQMGMVGQLYVRPRQNSVATGASLYGQLNTDQLDVSKKCDRSDLLCSVQLPPANNGATNGVAGNDASKKLYAYDDGDGSTAYDVEYPIQMHGFDPNFHFVGMTFNPESFADNKDKFFLLNGRGYPDTVNPDALSTQASDGTPHFSQPLPTVINIPAGGKALLRFSDLNVTEFHTLASLGIKMHVIGLNARLLRDQDGNNLDYYTNSITLGGGETIDVILDATGSAPGQKFYLYTPQLDHLSNDAENFGGMMTEVNVCSSFNPITKKCS
jgi:FtsP/CotA-like multicopper oxidase with cupredoxin domain